MMSVPVMSPAEGCSLLNIAPSDMHRPTFRRLQMIASGPMKLQLGRLNARAPLLAGPACRPPRLQAGRHGVPTRQQRLGAGGLRRTVASGEPGAEQRRRRVPASAYGSLSEGGLPRAPPIRRVGVSESYTVVPVPTPGLTEVLRAPFHPPCAQTRRPNLH